MTEQPSAPNRAGSVAPQSPSTTAWAIAALIFGIVGAWLLGIICGAIALAKIKTGQFGGRTMAVVGLILSGVWIVIAVVVLVVLLLLDSDDTNTSPARQYVPAVGTCFADEPDGRFEEDKAISCDQAHRVEVFSVYAIPGDTYPSSGVGDGMFNRRCETEFAQYAAEDATDVEIDDLLPSEQTWALGDRTVVCYALSAAPVNGSVKG